MLKFFKTGGTRPNQKTDEQLLEAYLQTSDQRQLGILYERYMPMVYGVCVKILKDSGKSEDAVMAIFEELTRKVREHKVESFRGWLYVLARNFALMEWRKQQRRPTSHLAPEDMERFDDAMEDPDFELPQADRPALERCLERLNDHQRTCVQMFYYEDFSYKDISEKLSLELGIVRSYIQNGKRNLRLCLENLK